MHTLMNHVKEYMRDYGQGSYACKTFGMWKFLMSCIEFLLLAPKLKLIQHIEDLI